MVPTITITEACDGKPVASDTMRPRGTRRRVAWIANVGAMTPRTSGIRPVDWRLGAALVLVVMAAVLRIVGSRLPMVLPDHESAFASLPMLVVLAILPATAALLAVGWGIPALAVGVVEIEALFAPGRLLSDLQLTVDVSASARPSLVMPTSLHPLQAGPGVWLLITAEACAMAAGMLAALAGRHHRGANRTGIDGDLMGEGMGRQGRFAAALCIGVVAAIALLVVAPFHSDNLYLLGRALLERQPLPLAGGLLVMLAAVVGPTAAAARSDASRAAGGLVGAAIALLSVSLPAVISGVAVPSLRPTWGPATVLATVMALVALAAVARGRARERVEPDAELTLPGQMRLQVAAGVLAMLAGASAMLAAVSTQIVVPEGLPSVHTADHRLLLPAGAVVAALGLPMLLRRSAAAVRPALAVACVAVPMASAEALDVVFTALQVDGVRAGSGVWLAALGAVLALAAACCCGLAGGVERDDVDMTERSVRAEVLVPACAAVALAVAGFGLPVLHAGGYSAPGLWADFRFGSWGMVLALVAVVLAAILAGFARPPRAVALLLGAAVVLGVRCAELPVRAAGVGHTSVGAGLPVGLVGVLALVVAAGVAAVCGQSRGRSEGGRQGRLS